MAFGDLTSIGSHNSVDAAVTRTITVGAAGVPSARVVFVYVASRDASNALTPTCADNVNGSYTSLELANGVSDAFLFYKVNNDALAEDDVITISNVQSGQAVNAHAFYADGLDTISPFVANTHASGSDDTTSTGSFSWQGGPYANELWLGFFAVAGTTAGTEDADWTNLHSANGSGAGGTSQNRSIRIASRVVTETTTDVYGPTTGGTQFRLISIASFKEPVSKKFWYPRTCSEDHGCIIRYSSWKTAIAGLAKTCQGHALEDWGRAVGLPVFTGLNNVTAAITGDQTIADAILTQNIAGTQQTYNPATNFRVYDEMRVGDLTANGLSNSDTVNNTKLWIYRGSMLAPGDAITDPPDPVFLASAFATLKANNPLVNYVILDHEGYPNNNGQLTPDGIQYYADLVDIAHDYWPNVAVYGVFPERYPSHFNHPIGSATYESRKSNWYARCSLMLPIAERVNAHWPSLYYIGTPATNSTHMELWIEQHKEICDLYGPGKPLIPTIWPRLHSSVDPSIPIVGGTHFRATLDKIYDVCDSVALWLQGGDSFSDISGTDMWTQLLDFIADNSITSVD